ncbi:MAG: hypothetical protein ACPGTS_00825 [Minisyncoccia bacterium]
MENKSKKFVTLEREYGSEMSRALRMVIIKETNEYLGVGGRICDMKKNNGKVETVNLSIVKYANTKEENVLVQQSGQAYRKLSDQELEKIKFCFNNLDY